MSRTEYSDHAHILRWSRVRLVLMLFDCIALLVALEAAYIARYTLGWSVHSDLSSLNPLVALVCLVTTLLIYRVFGLYSMQLVGSGLNEYRAISLDTTLSFATIVIIDYIDEGIDISRAFLLIFWVSAIGVVGIGRFVARRVVRRWSAKRGGLRRVLVVGANEQAVQIANELSTNPAACSVVLGFLSEYPAFGRSTNGQFVVLGEPMELYEIAKREGATHAVVVESSLSWESLRFIVRSMHTSRTPQVLLAPGLFDVAATPLQSTQLGRALLLAPRATRIYGFEAFFKRSLDLGVGFSALLLTFPIQLGIWISLRAAGVRRPIEVIRSPGFGGDVISVWRFAGGPRLRASHLTRLPSLWQVVTGDMSLIGPRLVLQEDSGQYRRWGDVLAALKPGFIGPWWLSGQSRPVDLKDEIEADLSYARSYSIWLDLRILLAVAWVFASGVLRGGTATHEQQRTGPPLNVGDED